MSLHVCLPRPTVRRQASLPVPPDPPTPVIIPSRTDRTLTPDDSPLTTPSPQSRKRKPVTPTTACRLHARLLQTPTLQIHVSAFTPVSRRFRKVPDLCIVHFATAVQAPQTPSWRAVATLHTLPGVATVSLAASALRSTLARLTFHTRESSRVLGETIAPIAHFAGVGARPVVLPARPATPAVAFAQARMACPPREQAFHTGIALVVRVAPSMQRDAKAATTVALTRAGEGGPIAAGCEPMARRRDRVTCLSVAADALWFALEAADIESAALRIEWLGAPKKGRRFVHGVLEISVNAFARLDIGQLVGVLWTAVPGGVTLNRSALVQDVALRDNTWCVDLTLTQ